MREPPPWIAGYLGAIASIGHESVVRMSAGGEMVRFKRKKKKRELEKLTEAKAKHRVAKLLQTPRRSGVDQLSHN